MKTIDTDDAAPQFAMGAAIDAQEQHKKYWGTHTPAKQQLATQLKTLAYEAYGLNGSKVYLNAREGFIVVKIDKPQASTVWLRAPQLNAMNTFVQAQNVEVVASKRNLLFRIPK